MKRTSAAARVRRAQAELAAAESALEKNALPWRRRWRKDRGALAILGGFTGGLALALLPPRWWARVGAVVGATAAAAARSALIPAVVGAMLSQVRRSDKPAQAASSPAAE